MKSDCTVKRRGRYGMKAAGEAQEAGKLLEMTRTIIFFVDDAKGA
jgi:hypothetical protein